jgi:hypothetical protein
MYALPARVTVDNPNALFFNDPYILSAVSVDFSRSGLCMDRKCIGDSLFKVFGYISIYLRSFRNPCVAPWQYLL